MSTIETEPQRPPRPAFLKVKQQTPGLLDPLRRRAKRAAVLASDRGWFGLNPLKTHVVICGFPRSGSTLLLLMAETAVPAAKVFHEEKTGLKAAHQFWPGRQPLMITKRPNDVFFADEIRDFYRGRGTQVRFVLCARDPRAVLTSVHERQPGYYVSPARWRAIYAHFVYVRPATDVLTVEFNDLVRTPQVVQERLAAFIGWRAACRFEEFADAVPTSFDTRALNGVRPLDPSAIDRWKAPEHQERIRAMLQELPELPSVLIELGYESDTSWTDPYR
jgi:hypothetical protein